MHLPRSERGRIIAYGFAGFSFFVAVLIIIFFALPRAEIHVILKTEPVAHSFTLLLDTELQSVSVELPAIPAERLSKKEASRLHGRITHHDLLVNEGSRDDYLYIASEDMHRLAKRQLEKQLLQPVILQEESLTFSISSVFFVKAKQAKVLVAASALALPIVPLKEWQQNATLSPKVLEQLIMSSDGVENVKILLFPKFFRFLPLVLENRQFILDN